MHTVRIRSRRGKELVCLFVGHEEKPEKSPCSPSPSRPVATDSHSSARKRPAAAMVPAFSTIFPLCLQVFQPCAKPCRRSLSKNARFAGSRAQNPRPTAGAQFSLTRPVEYGLTPAKWNFRYFPPFQASIGHFLPLKHAPSRPDTTPRHQRPKARQRGPGS